ncbi:raftlin-like [Brienomyrus brachyistius]|uniref:raftlin-like n=1 Tax=Brienomyrus brachyistius TaxID=42636 RepID=UPI0020B3020B|nr:raftlin-like [Brienomyrus brachyistius]XP_048881297.1 raftlin-like [Brienomyrus brachyistius]
MGCKLPKLKRPEDSSPGKIYSTLKRPQVETKVGVAYTYRFLDFILGKDDGTSMLCISSVRELPAQMLDLYQQGFVLAAVHPFIHPCGTKPGGDQRLLYRAVLIRLSDSGEKPETKYDNHLEMETCLSADQAPNTELIQGYLKKIQDSAEQGITFVGFVQQPSRAFAVHAHDDPEDVSLSLHSSPSSVQGEKSQQNQENREQNLSEEQHHQGEIGEKTRDITGEFVEVVLDEARSHNGDSESAEDRVGGAPESPVSATLSTVQRDNDESWDVRSNDTLKDNNNKAKGQQATKERQNDHTPPRIGVELFALFNHPKMGKGLLKYYTVKVPLRVQCQDESIVSVEANWLDHMTQHFHSGALLIDGYFHLGSENDVSPTSVESIFIFQEGQEVESNSATAYDAIVVEQWTVIDGVGVKTDYIPLLQSLATYGWRLTCVLPTPVVKTNSDGSLATKQIVFLQRPVLPRRRKESKKLNFKTRNKSNKNSVKDAPNDKAKKSESPGVEKGTGPKMSDEGENVSKAEMEAVVRRNDENRESEGLRLERDKGERKVEPADEDGISESGEKAKTEEDRGGGGMVETEVDEEGEVENPEEEKDEIQASTEKKNMGRREETGEERECLAEEESQKNLALEVMKGGAGKEGHRAAASENSGMGQSEQCKRDSHVEIQVSVEPGLTQETLGFPSSPDHSSNPSLKIDSD